MKKCAFVVICVFLLLFAGCGDEEVGAGERCGAGEELNPLTDECVRVETGDDEGDHDGDEGDQEPGDGDPGGDNDGDADGSDGDNDGEVDPPPTARCEVGMDPTADVECSFLAHSSSTLYRVDPFRQTVETIRNVPDGLFDIDTHPDGRIFGITHQTLHRLDSDDGEWVLVGNMGVFQNANGLCINMGGTAYMTAENRLYIVDLETANVTSVGSMGWGYNSSGDCVIDKGNRLYMSSNAGFSGADTLVEIDASTAQASSVGNTGFSQIYGLTAAWGLLIGTTGNGEVILINPSTGAAELMFQTSPSIEFYGAASTPER